MTTPGLPDLILLLVVTGQVLALAYLHSPRAKSLVYMLPLPFSAALVATGHGVDATHIIGMGAVWGFLWLVWLLHVRWGMKIILADVCSLLLYAGLSLLLAAWVPVTWTVHSAGYWVAIGVLLVACAAASRLPPPRESGHRSSLPIAIKGPLVFALILVLILSKNALRGFMPSFPMVTVFAVYEARHSLRTLAQRMQIFVAGFACMASVIAVLLPAQSGLTPTQYLLPLAAGWAVYLPLYWLLDRWYTRRSHLGTAVLGAPSPSSACAPTPVETEETPAARVTGCTNSTSN